ncbi:hypothetical protein HU200_012536 [Digitaria exilis]|uniref:Uncharacterized protein n=1 Tax=Digitaria exilis TaxID=1010633 RepID=A0A835FFU2_9POAL|nr:hypothetical protein HU200_012536 [Digitaria exilis]
MARATRPSPTRRRRFVDGLFHPIPHPKPVAGSRLPLRRREAAPRRQGVLPRHVVSGSGEEPAAPEAKQRPSGDSFIRRHLRTLSPYQPILPFEVYIIAPRTARFPPCVAETRGAYAREVLVEMPRGVLLSPLARTECSTAPITDFTFAENGSSHQVLSARLGRRPEDIIKLDANEIHMAHPQRCVLEPGDKIVDCPPTLQCNEFDASVNGALSSRVGN